MNNHKNKAVLKILTESFQDNQSINYIVNHNPRKLKVLLKYSIFYGENFGEVLLSDCGHCCAILIDSRKKKTTLRSALWDIRLLITCIGLFNLTKTIRREKLISQHHPKSDFYHLWYIGVSNQHRELGKGTLMMKRIIKNALDKKMQVYLETSTKRNIPFYEKLGFVQTANLDQLGYPLKMLSLKF